MTLALPTYVGSSTALVGTSNVNARIDCSSMVPGDLIILAVQSSNEAVPSTPSGFTPCPNSPQGVGTAATAGATRLTLFYKIATYDDTVTGATVLVLDTGNHTLTIAYAFRGVSRSNPFDTSSGGTENTPDTSFADSGLTTTVDDCLIAVLIANSIDAAGEQLSSPTNANLGSVTNRTSINVANGTGGGINLITGTKAAAGATGSTTATYAANSAFGFVTLALRPADHPFVKAIGTQAGGTSGATPTLPSHAAGDLLLAFVESAGGESTTTPSGWTRLPNAPWSAGSGTSGTKLDGYYKVATSSSETNPAFTDPGEHICVIEFTIANLGGSPIESPVGAADIGPSTFVSIPGIDTTQTHQLVLYVVTRDNGASGSVFSAWSNATLAGFAELYDSGNGVGFAGFGIAAGVKVTPGATGTTTATDANSDAHAWACFGIRGASSTPLGKSQVIVL